MKNDYFLKVYTFNRSRIIHCITLLLYLCLIHIIPVYAQWTPKQNAFFKRSEVASVVYKDKVYCFAGFDSTLNVINSSEVYDPALNKWTLLAAGPEGKTVTHQGVALIDGKVWHIGGRVGRNPGRLTSEIWIYDIEKNSWEPGPQLKDPGTNKPLLWGGGGAALIGRTLHVFGGFTGTACKNDQNKYHLTLNVDQWLANPTQVVWENKRAPLPVKRNHFGTVVMGGKIYAIGGQFGHDCGGGQDQAYSHVYNPITNTWKELTRMPTPRSHIEGGIFPLDGKIYIVAGQGAANKSQNRVTVFTPEANNGLGAWSDEETYKLPYGYEGVSGKVVGNTFIISHGGVGNSNGTRKETYTALINRNIPYKLGFVGACFSKTLKPGEKKNIQNLLYTLEGEKQFNLTSSADWLKITKNSSGLALPSAIYINAEIDATSLTPGNYSATITATGTGSGPTYAGASFCVNIKVETSETNYTLSVATIGDGTVTTDPDQNSYSNGSIVKLTATPAAGQQFIEWSGAATGTTNPLMVTMDDDKNITALFEPIPAIEELITAIKSDSSRRYALATLAVGMKIYTDRSYRITDLPFFLEEASFIQAPNDDKRISSATYMSFNLTQDATVYVAYDPRAKALPAWLNGWEKLPDVINVTDATITYLHLYSKKFPSGPVSLGGNLAPPATGAENNYLIAAQDNAAVSKLVATPTELIFDGVKGTTAGTKSFILKNESTSPVSITSTNKAGADVDAFKIIDMPATLAAGQSVTVKVSFQPGSKTGYHAASLQINSSDPANAINEIKFYGLSTNGWEGANEPSLASVVKTLGFDINVGWETLANGTSAEQKGEEIAAPYFRKAGAGKVSIMPVARFSPNQELPFGFYTKNSNNLALTPVGTLSGAIGQHQALFPKLVTGSTEFEPGLDQFGFYVQGLGNRLTYTEDALNADGPALHAVRIYPLKNRQGVPVANNYLVCFEDAANGDYQDYVFVVSNVIPVQISHQVVSFTLVNVDTEQDIQTLTNGATINLAALPTRNLNIRANTNKNVGSVLFNLSGRQTQVAQENIMPYALFGGNDYNAWTPATGNYTLQATPYTKATGGGTAGGTLAINFNVIDEVTAVNKVATNFQSQIDKEILTGNTHILSYPNPVSDGKFNVLLPGKISGDLAYTLMTQTGVILKQGKYSETELKANLPFNFSREIIASGVYYLKLNGNKLNKTLKIVKD